jgi:hypothetical protein
MSESVARNCFSVIRNSGGDGVGGCFALGVLFGQIVWPQTGIHRPLNFTSKPNLNEISYGFPNQA